MKRLFLFVAVFVASGALAVDLSAGGSAKAPKEMRAPLIVNEDNDHFFKQDKSLMTVEALEAYIDEYAKGHVTHFFMCPSGHCAGILPQRRGHELDGERQAPP